MKQTILFDLGGVLLREAEANLHKAHDSELQYLLNNNVARVKIFNRAFDFVALVSGVDLKAAWLIGTKSGHEIAQLIKTHIDNPEHTYFFTDEYERTLIKYGIEYVITPELLTQLTEIIDEGLKFLHECKASGIEVGIISNWDPISFEILRNQLPKFFILFPEKNIIIPHMAGATKPSREIYEYAIQKMNVDPAHCFFIDDSRANVEGARICGIKSVHHTNWHQTKEELLQHGLKLSQQEEKP